MSGQEDARLSNLLSWLDSEVAGAVMPPERRDRLAEAAMLLRTLAPSVSYPSLPLEHSEVCGCPRCEKAEAERAIRLAYGLLWHMHIDRRDENLRLASDARRALVAVLSMDERADGIARAKAADGRFTGAT